MKKILFMLAALLLMSACSQEEPLTVRDGIPEKEGVITRQQALETLQRVRGEFFPQTRGKSFGIASCEAYGSSLQPSTRSNEDPVFYVFNYEDNQGFAIMAATPKLPQVLAISDKGNLDMSNLPDNGVRLFANGLPDYSDWIEERDTGAVPDGVVYTKKFHRTNVKTTPLCKVKWHQNYPYNQYTPIVNGQNALVGCGGVAVAQAMSVYGQPTSFQGYDFDWQAMTAKNPSDDAVKQTARFMEVIGREGIGGFDYYNPNGTGAILLNIKDILLRCDYSCTLPEDTVIKDNGFSTIPKLYKDIDVIGELLAGRPVIVNGQTDVGISGIGHFWLLHGYMQIEWLEEKRINRPTGVQVLSSKHTFDDYVLCNWGWGGMYDGYYLSGVFDLASEDYIPDDQGIPMEGSDNYSHVLRALIDIKPNRK